MKTLRWVVSAGCAVLLGTSAWANDHAKSALSHAQSARQAGISGQANDVATRGIVKEATEALSQARAAKEEIQDPHLDAAIKLLEETIEAGRKGDQTVASDRVGKAWRQLKNVSPTAPPASPASTPRN